MSRQKSLVQRSDITEVYNKHTCKPEHALTEMQRHSFQQIISALHVHLDQHNCVDVLVTEGKGQDIMKSADRLTGTMVVKHGKLGVTTTKKSLNSPYSVSAASLR